MTLASRCRDLTGGHSFLADIWAGATWTETNLCYYSYLRRLRGRCVGQLWMQLLPIATMLRQAWSRWETKGGIVLI